MGPTTLFSVVLLIVAAIWGLSRNVRRKTQTRSATDAHARIKASPDYQLIRRFVQRGAHRGTLAVDDIERLTEVLPEEYGLDVASVRELVLNEAYVQEAAALRAIVLSAEPSCLTELLDAFIDATRPGRLRREREVQALGDACTGNLENMDDVGKMISALSTLTGPHDAQQRRELALLRDLIVELGFGDACDVDLPTVATLECDRRLGRERDAYRNALLNYQPDQEASDLDALSGIEFEQYLCRLFERLGYQVVTTPTTGDQGADLVLIKAGLKTVVQAKRYTGTVGNSAVQEVVAARRHYGADEAMVVTTSTFTSAAQALAASNAVTLVDGTALRRLDYGT